MVEFVEHYGHVIVGAPKGVPCSSEIVQKVRRQVKRRYSPRPAAVPSPRSRQSPVRQYRLRGQRAAPTPRSDGSPTRAVPGLPRRQPVQRDQVVCNHSAAELDASHFSDRAHHAMGLKADHQLAMNLLSTYAHIPATCTNVHQKVSANVHAHRLRWERTRTQAR